MNFSAASEGRVLLQTRGVKRFWHAALEPCRDNSDVSQGTHYQHRRKAAADSSTASIASVLMNRAVGRSIAFSCHADFAPPLRGSWVSIGRLPRTSSWAILLPSLRDCAVAFPGPGLRGGESCDRDYAVANPKIGTAKWHSQDRDYAVARDAPGSFPTQLGARESGC
jgi:hypothetical protein